MPRTEGQPRRNATRPYKKTVGDKGGGQQLPSSLSACKKQVRDVTRLLKRNTLDSSGRVDLERRLKALTVLQSQMTSAQKDRDNASRYHGIKFFERKKVLRKLGQVEKRLSATQPESKLVAVERAGLLVDLNYTTYYPNEFKYISLYPNDPAKTSEVTREKQEFIRKSIAEAMDRGELPKDPRLVDAGDRKAIRKTNKFMLRNLALAQGDRAAESEEGEALSGGEEDEFFE